jgi:hypothetical protein
MLEAEVEVFQNPFGEGSPEATADGEPGATIYIRYRHR